MKRKNYFIIAVMFGLFLLAPNVFADGFTCDDDAKAVLSIVRIAINIVKTIVPLVLVIMAVIDVFKVVTNGKDADGERKKAFTTLGVRFVLGILIFFIPNIVRIIFKAINPDGYTTAAIDCTLYPDKTPTCGENQTYNNDTKQCE